MLAPNSDPREAALEASEFDKYLLAKAFFENREFDRCAAVFLSESLLSNVMSTKQIDATTSKGKGKAGPSFSSKELLPPISQRSLFLALYAKFLSGEKTRDEETEMIMGPQDLGTIVNKQLLVVSRFLERWFTERKSGMHNLSPSQGFLEYL